MGRQSAELDVTDLPHLKIADLPEVRQESVVTHAAPRSRAERGGRRAHGRWQVERAGTMDALVVGVLIGQQHEESRDITRPAAIRNDLRRTCEEYFGAAFAGWSSSAGSRV